MSRPWNSRPIPSEVRRRASTKWVQSGDCRISTYSTGSHGYAQVGWRDNGKKRTVLAHRAAWEDVYGPVPEGMTLDHMCKTKRCVNPEHMRVLSNYENARRTSGRDWPLGQCANGHPQSETVQIPSGKLVCDPCRKAWNRRHLEKKRAERSVSA